MVEPFEVRWSSPQASCSALWARPAHPFLSHQTGGWGIPVGFLAHLLGPGSGNTLGFLRQGIQDQGWFPCSLQLSQRSEDPPTCSAGDTGDAGLIPGSGRPPGVGTVNPLHYDCLVIQLVLAWVERIMLFPALVYCSRAVTDSCSCLAMFYLCCPFIYQGGRFC